MTSNQNKNINNSNKRQKQLGRISSLGLLFPQSFNNNTNNQQHPIVYRGRSFVNLLPPPSRIEQNALPPLLCTRVNSDKFVNYMSGSPPPLPPSDLKDSSKSSSSPSSQSIQKQQQQHYQKRQNQRRRPFSVSGSNVDAISVVRHAPMRQFSTSNTTIISSPPSASQQQQKEEEKQLNLKMFKKDEKDEEDENTTTTTNLINCSLKESTSCGGGQQHEIVKRQVSNSLDVEVGHPRIRSTSTTGTASSAIDRRSVSQHNQLQEKASLKSSLKIEDTILRLNIGGSSYRIRTRSILKHGADTLLGRFIRMDEQHRRAWADAYFEEESEYFFERVPRYFDPVYDFYASGKLHVPKDLCFDKFMAELRFWSVSKAKVDQCCSPFAQYYLYKKTKNLDTPEKDHFIGLRCAKVRRRLWLILEGHSNSKWWKFFEITSTSFVVLSITALILASMPEFQVPDNSNQNTMSLGKHSTNPTYPKVSGFTISTTTVVKDGEEHRIEMIEHPVFNYVENICVIYFTLEYLLRFWVAPIKSQFVKEFLNIIDLLAIAPFLFELLLIFIGIRGDNIRKVRWAFLTVRLLRVLRVVRIAKLGRFSPGLANFALTLQRSKKQMQMVAIVLLTVIIFFSTLVYFMEKDEPNTTFTSIPAAFWWCLFSQTKWVPQTASGKIVGGGAIICGVLVLALPIAILVNNFMQVVRLREEKLIRQQYYVTNTASGGSIVGGEHRV